MIEAEKLKPHLIYLSFLLILFCSCKQNKAVEQSDKNEAYTNSSINSEKNSEKKHGIAKLVNEKEEASKFSDNNIISIEPRPELMPNYFDTSEYHIYNDLVLRKSSEASYGVKIGEYLYNEVYPGVIWKTSKNGGFTEEILFLDPNKDNKADTVKIVVPSEYNPFRKRDGDIRIGYPSFERYSPISKEDSPNYKNRTPDYFITTYGITSLISGHLSLNYKFTPIIKEGNTMLPWEFSSVIFNKNGEVIGTINGDHHISVHAVSGDDKYAIYKYGFNTNDPYEDIRHGEYRIIDLENDKILKKMIPAVGFEIKMIRVEKNGIVRLAYSDYMRTGADNEMLILDFVDFDNRKRYYKKFLKEEIYANDIEVLKTGIRSQLINKYDFEITKF